jgi:hypothetical protein
VLNFRAELAEKSYKELAVLSRAAKSAVARWKVGAKRWSICDHPLSRALLTVTTSQVTVVITLW